MRITRCCLVFALTTILVGVALGTADEDPTDEENWLNEKTWPAFVAAGHLKVADNDDRLTKLLKERYNAGQQEFRSRYIYWVQGSESFAEICEVARRVVEARTEAGGPGSDKVEILKEKLTFAKIAEKQAERLQRKFHRANQESDVNCATYFRATAELELLRAEKSAAETRDK